MRVLIAGGTGTIGRRLIDHLFASGHTVTLVSRQPFRPATIPAKVSFHQWNGQTAQGWGHILAETEAVVNLAGAGLAEQRWSAARKQQIMASRAQAGQAMVEAFKAASHKPKVLIQASAVGYYGPNHSQTALTESSPAGQDFLAQVCRQWENSTQAIEELGVRRVVIRTGVVLDTLGGALPKMLIPIRFFGGGPIGSGGQWMSWIHYHDEVAAIRFLLENQAITGPVNLTAPNPVPNRHLIKAIGKVLHRPSFMPTPGLVLKLIFGEMASILLEGQQVLPGRLEGAGFKFNYPTLEPALQALLS